MQVMTEVVEGYRRVKHSRGLLRPPSEMQEKPESGSDNFAQLDIQKAGANSVQAIQKILSEAKSRCQCGHNHVVDPRHWTQRRYFTAMVLRQALLEDPASKELAASYLLHIVLAETLPLENRRIRLEKHDNMEYLQKFLNTITEALLAFIRNDGMYTSIGPQAICDIADVLDGRLWFATIMDKPLRKKDASLQARFEEQAHILCALTGVHLSFPLGRLAETPTDDLINGVKTVAPTILPFSNVVFDKHLAPIRLATASSKGISPESGRIFKEVSHWHNAKRRLITKTVTPLSGKDKMRAARRNDNFMAEMQSYAASLTNATGKSLEPEIVTLGGTSISHEVSKETGVSAKASARQAGPKAAQKGKGGKKQAMLEDIAANRAVKDHDIADKVFAAWRMVRKNLEAERSLVMKYHKMGTYSRDLPDQKRKIVGAEVQFHLVCVLVDIYRETFKGQNSKAADMSPESLGVRALIWDTSRRIPSYAGFTKTIAAHTKAVIKAVKLSGIDIPTPSEDKPLAYDPGLLLPKEDFPAPKVNNQDFQLLQCGPYMDRNLDSVSR